MTKNNTTLKRPNGSYSAQYLAHRPAILLYRETHKEQVAAYMRAYMRRWRLKPENAQKHTAYVAVRGYLMNRKYAMKSRGEFLLGCSREQFAAERNLTINQLVTQLKKTQVDHIEGMVWLMKNRPEFAPYYHRHYNLQLVTKRLNCKKHAYVDVASPIVQRILGQMELELLKSKVVMTKEDFERVEQLQLLTTQEAA